jgi:citrate lyase beta subunit
VSRSFPDDAWGDLLERARRAADEHRRRFPGDVGAGQPLQTLYVPADRVTATTTVQFGAEALRLLDAHAADPASFEVAFGVDAAVAERARARVLSKLEREPVEDLRVDFEDGYGARPDDEEDRHAEAAARAVQASRGDGTAPPSFGLRVKSFADGAEARSLRTLDTFVSTLTEAAGGLPDGFVVTFPKVTTAEHVAAFAEALERLEVGLGLAERSLRFEVQVETPRSVIGPDGSVAAPGILEASGGRLTAMHFGVFDYTASLGLMPWEQRLDHPANDFARHALQVALAGTGVRISDGSSNVAPATDRTDDVHSAWRVHADHVRHSLRHGFYQGWDLHPAHLVSRYAAVYGWLLPHLDDAASRVRAWRRQVEAPGVLDEPATVSSLLRYLRFAVSSGAVEEAEVLETAGLARDELLGSEEEAV